MASGRPFFKANTACIRPKEQDEHFYGFTPRLLQPPSAPTSEQYSRGFTKLATAFFRWIIMYLIGQALQCEEKIKPDNVKIAT
jgi:hypothetical protein